MVARSLAGWGGRGLYGSIPRGRQRDLLGIALNRQQRSEPCQRRRRFGRASSPSATRPGRSRNSSPCCGNPPSICSSMSAPFRARATIRNSAPSRWVPRSPPPASNIAICRPSGGAGTAARMPRRRRTGYGGTPPSAPMPITRSRRRSRPHSLPNSGSGSRRSGTAPGRSGFGPSSIPATHSSYLTTALLVFCLRCLCAS